MTEADQQPDRSPAMATLRAELAIPPDVPALQGEEDTVRLACWMLRVTQPWPEAVRETTEALLAAHRDGVEDPGEWRKLRRAAIGLSENDAPEVKAFGHVAEAAAWPLASSSAGLVELMQAICGLRARRASMAQGWTSADEAEAHSVLSQIAQGDGITAPAREDIPQLFMNTHPELERRFSINLQVMNAAFVGFRMEVMAWISGAAR